MISCIRIIAIMLVCFSANLLAEDKVVLISGGNGGLGQATVKAFYDKGWKVWAGYHKNIPVECFGNGVNWVHLDVTNDYDVLAAVQKVLATEGKIDALINNAGYGLISADDTLSMDSAKDIFEVNFFGALRLIQAVAPLMRVQESGHIINISSTSGVRAVPGLGMYAASKFALEGLSESLAVTLSPWNIKVSLIEPGTVNNEWIHHCVLNTEEEEPLYKKFCENLQAKLSTLAATGQPCEEIAALIVQAAESENPDMRIQTSQKVKDTVSKKFVELSGNALRQEQITFLKSLTQ